MRSYGFFCFLMFVKIFFFFFFFTVSVSSYTDLFIFLFTFPFRHELPVLFMCFFCEVSRLVDTFFFFFTFSRSQLSNINSCRNDEEEIFRSRISRVGTCRNSHLFFFCILAMLDLCSVLFFLAAFFLFNQSSFPAAYNFT